MSNAALAVHTGCAEVFVLHLTELKGLLFHFLVTAEFKYLWFGLWAPYYKVVSIAISR